MTTPYADQVGDRDPVEVLATSLADYQVLTSRLTPAQWATPWAPGKWTAHQVVVHITQWEMIFGVRLRCGLAVPGYMVQPFDQDPFMFEAATLDGPTAFRAFDAMRQMNLALAPVTLTRRSREDPATPRAGHDRRRESAPDARRTPGPSLQTDRRL